MSESSEPTPRTDGPAIAPVSKAHWAVIGIFVILCVASVALARDFLMPVIMAFLLTLVFTPFRRGMNRIGMPSWLAAAVIVGGLVSALFVSIWTLSGPVAEWASEAPSLGREIERKIKSLREPVDTIAEAGEEIDKLAEGEATPGTQKVEVKEKGFTQRVAATAPKLIAQTTFVLVLMFFVIASGDMFYEKLVHVLPTLTDKRRALKIAFDIERRLARYFSTIAVINATLGLAIAVGLWWIDMPNPALIGIAAFVLNFVPFIGAILGIILTTVIGFVSYPDPWMALAAGGLYFTLTTVEGQFVTPYFVGRSLKLNTVVVFLSVALWAWLWSVVGMVIAVPVLVVIRVLCEHIPSLQALGDFLSARGAETLEPDTSEQARVRPKLSDS